MSLLNKINDDLKTAMRAKDELVVGALRQIKDTVSKAGIKKGKDLTEEEVPEVIFSLVKSHNDSIESFKKGGRADLVEKEEKELAVIKRYLPAQLTDDELKKIVEDAVKETGAASVKDTGKVMGKVMPKVKGKADGSKVGALVKEALEKLKP